MRLNEITRQVVDAAMKVHSALGPEAGGEKVGLLITFHVEHLRDGIRRVVNGDIQEEEMFSSVTSAASRSSVLKSC